MVEESDKMRLALDEDGKPLPGGPVRQRDGKRWHPTENQVAALEYVLERDCKFKIAEMAKAIGMSRRNWCDWRHTPAFVAWWKEKLDEWVVDELPAIYAALVRAAKGQKSASRMQVAAAKVLIERFDRAYAPWARRDVNLKGGASVGVGNAKLEAILDEVIARFPKQPTLAQDTAGEHAGEENPASD